MSVKEVSRMILRCLASTLEQMDSAGEFYRGFCREMKDELRGERLRVEFCTVNF